MELRDDTLEGVCNRVLILCSQLLYSTPDVIFLVVPRDDTLEGVCNCILVLCSQFLYSTPDIIIPWGT